MDYEQPDMKFIKDLEQQLAAFIQTLDPNSDLCHWLINTHTRLIKAQDMARE